MNKAGLMFTTLVLFCNENTDRVSDTKSKSLIK